MGTSSLHLFRRASAGLLFLLTSACGSGPPPASEPVDTMAAEPVDSAAPMPEDSAIIAHPSPSVGPSIPRVVLTPDSLVRRSIGSVAYTHPDSMYLGQVETVRLLVSSRKSGEELSDVLRDLDSTHGTRSDSVELTQVMRAHLGGVGFEITPQTPEEQTLHNVLEGQREGIWSWQVKPLQNGSLQLFVTLDAMYRIDGQDRWATARQLTDTVQVRVSPDTLAARERAHRDAVRGGVWKFVLDNIQWLWAILVVPIGGLIWKRLRS